MISKKPEEIIDLSPQSLRKLCKGNVKNLPTFMVHDNDVWPYPEVVRIDSKNRIHLRRATFLAVVVGQVPVSAGIWHRIDVQEFSINLQPHHLNGGSEETDAQDYKHTRSIVSKSTDGTMEGDQDYDDHISDAKRQPRNNVGSGEIAKARRDGRSLGSSVFSNSDGKE